MLNKLRGFSNTKLAGVLIAIIIIPFVFWGMGSVFSGGNTNSIAKINDIDEDDIRGEYAIAFAPIKSMISIISAEYKKHVFLDNSENLYL